MGQREGPQRSSVVAALDKLPRLRFAILRAKRQHPPLDAEIDDAQVSWRSLKRWAAIDSFPCQVAPKAILILRAVSNSSNMR